MAQGALAIDWHAVAREHVHPLRLAVLELMVHATEPLSPVQLTTAIRGLPPVNGQPPASLGVVSYHVRWLYNAGLLESAGQRPVRGAVEHFYQLAPGLRMPGAGPDAELAVETAAAPAPGPRAAASRRPR